MDDTEKLYMILYLSTDERRAETRIKKSPINIKRIHLRRHTNCQSNAAKFRAPPRRIETLWQKLTISRWPTQKKTPRAKGRDCFNKKNPIYKFMQENRKLLTKYIYPVVIIQICMLIS